MHSLECKGTYRHTIELSTVQILKCSPAGTYRQEAVQWTIETEWSRDKDRLVDLDAVDRQVLTRCLLATVSPQHSAVAEAQLGSWSPQEPLPSHGPSARVGIGIQEA